MVKNKNSKYFYEIIIKTLPRKPEIYMELYPSNTIFLVTNFPYNLSSTAISVSEIINIHENFNQIQIPKTMIVNYIMQHDFKNSN